MPGYARRRLAEVIAELSTEAIDSARFMLIAQEGALKAADSEVLPEVDGRTREVAPAVEPSAFDGAEDAEDAGGTDTVPDVAPDVEADTQDKNEGGSDAVAAQDASNSDGGGDDRWGAYPELP